MCNETKQEAATEAKYFSGFAHVLALLFLHAPVAILSPADAFGGAASRGLYQDGDIIIGGLFHLHYVPPTTDHNFSSEPDYKECTGLEQLPLQYIYATVFAVEEINRNPRLLPGVSLGYHIRDSCAMHPWATQAALALVSGDSSTCNLTVTPVHAFEEGGRKGVPLIIGGASSKTAMILSRVLAPLSVPLMSYQASCPCLSDRRQFPNFFRTVPSDIYQARAIARLAIYFKWTWIGAVVANNDYGLVAVKVFQEETQGSGVCLAFVETLNRQIIKNDARKAALAIKASSAKVILVFSWYTDVRELFLQLAEMNVTDKQFLASEAWSTSGNLLQHPVTSKVASGVLGMAIRSSPIVGFEDYIRGLTPSHRPDDHILREFWEKQFACRPWLSNVTNLSDWSASLPMCGGEESLKGVDNLFTDTSQLRQAYNAYLAVYAAAHALHDRLSCPNSNMVSRDSSSTCLSPGNVKPAELLQHLNDVNFTTPQEERLYFEGADIPAKYDLVNWQMTTDGVLKLVLIGRVEGYEILMNDSAVQWSSGYSQVPTSVCSESCPPGTRVATRKGEPICCFDCIPCAEGEISNITGSPTCDRCPLEFWSNAEHTVCVLRQLDFLAFNETLGITLTAVAASGTLVTTAVFVVFLYYKHTPVVRANNSELSFLLLLSLKLCFLCSLLFIGRPSVWSCRFQQAAFGISFVLSVSCLQVKTIVVLAAFRSARPGAEALMKWFGPGQQRGSVCLFTSIQIIICIIWLSLSPPEPKPDFDTPGLKVTLKCDMASVVGFSLVLGYIGLLACTCLLLAFLARNLPDNFNEAKMITFSMLIFCAVWVAFVPAYVSSPGKYMVAVEIFAMLASSYGLLFCIFAPKCFIILLRPEKNTKKHLMAR
ncbi:extracellular calcium-sensing receptor [Corythoichthys intestinalis]|uniref:extracellular calcium-sensing receptor n=1 Tax=Corythoichthys intestinalis TaxID=161448 RepID=UPI0025A5F17E|nr:extracellular calcium-sensing receptor [Corythoichthys intestinalis]